MRAPRASSVAITGDSLIVDLVDGRTVTAPLAWYPRLVHGTPEERLDFRLVGEGAGIHWPRLDEDVSVEGILAGLPSGESHRSLQGWLRDRESAG